MLNLNIHTQTKPKPKPTQSFKNCSYVCAYNCVQLWYTAQHRTVLIIFPLILQTVIIAQMPSTGGRRQQHKTRQHTHPHNWNNALRYIFDCCWRESVKPLQFYCNTVPSSYMTDERTLQFYRKILLSKNVILRTLTCLTGAFSDHMFLCSKYAVRPTSTRDSIKDAVTHAFMASVDVYL